MRRLAVILGSNGRRALLVIALATTAVFLGACGSNSSGVASIPGRHSAAPAAPTPAASGLAPYTAALEYARCMRSHGEPGFPDPNNPGGFSTEALAQLNPSSRQFVSANSTCQRLLPNDGQPTPAELRQTITEGLRFAHCMRANRVEFPDPGISGDQITLDLANVNTSSPQYLSAAQACRTKPGA
jgi:hypothetical protein